ncbi:hypothetical protein ATO12_22720 [Aquimarina atlantica]|uniref:Uncharacterized protein n=1 Tax=Aquimarina atlantica TaxID=1317122 RepID=A0A023BR92_9FLAO|nr:hypothetical protein [Aquimarina atlantica]EZH72268.1 hypothetical protein ATO12_22720 [Aquimarina atlantica]
MSNENYNDEIDLMQIFGMIKKTFKSFLRSIISVIVFYKKKWILFFILFVVGGVTGYFIDQNQDTKDKYVQEIIIEPKYNSAKYIYDFIEELENNFQDDNFLKNLGISLDHAKNIKKISIEPVIKGTDVLDNLQERYKNREFFKDIMTAYEEGKLEEEGFRDFYKHHKLTINFNKASEYNSKMISSILGYIKSNKYYQKISNLTLKQKKIDIERNKKSLQFIDAYLSNLEKAPLKAENEAIIISSGSELPMVSIASLLQKKELLIELINDQERALILDKEIFSFVDYGDVISKRKKLLNRMMILIPLLLIGLFSLFYFLRYLNREIKEFVKDE